jgi:hypothetical protein
MFLYLKKKKKNDLSTHCNDAKELWWPIRERKTVLHKDGCPGMLLKAILKAY